MHGITLESITDGKQKTAVCLSGKGACPPEDCGGIWGYEDIKHIFETAPGSRQANDCRKWLGLKRKEIWDAKGFDIEKVNDLLKKIPVNKQCGGNICSKAHFLNIFAFSDRTWKARATIISKP